MQPIDKTCTKCAVTKPLSQFSKAPGGLYGLKSSCKACDAARHAALHPSKPRVGKPRRAPFTGDELKTCTKCGEVKPMREFSLSSRATETRNAVYKPSCKVCSSAQALQWFHDNKERHKETKHRWSLQSLYGMTPDEYLALLEAQGGHCAVCGNGEPNAHGRTGTQFRLSVDHCHETGRVRGLLCQKCNRAIGLLGDNTELLRKAILYLERK